MAFNGSGLFNRLYSWVTDAANSVKISSTRMDGEMNGMATGLSNCVCRDGQSVITADMPWNSHKITGLAAATANGDAVRYEQISSLQPLDASLTAYAALTTAADKGIYFSGADTPVTFDLTSAMRTLLGSASNSAFRTAVGLAIGTDVQAYNSNLTTWAAKTCPSGTIADLTSSQTFSGKAIAASQLTSATLASGAGFSATSYSAGTKSSGTFTPDPANGNFQHYTNGGAHTLAPPSTVCTMIIECTNSSAGAITTSSFSIVDGDIYSSSGTKKHIFYITKTNSYSRLTVTYVTGT